MATIVTTVDNNVSNYENMFTYTMNISFNGMEERIDKAEVKFFVPDTMEYRLPAVQDPIKKVTTEDIPGGTWITLDFEAIVNSGVTAAVDFSCKFTLEEEEGTEFTLEPEMWINEKFYSSTPAEAVTLTLVPRFILKSTKLLPSIDPVSGSTATYLISLSNVDGDKWGKISDVNISQVLPDNLSYDTSFEVIGNDVSESPFTDVSADGIEGVIDGQTLTFNIKEYKGTEYHIIYRLKIDDVFNVEDEILFQTNWTADGESKLATNSILTIGEAEYEGRGSIYGPDYTLSGEYLNYQLGISNEGNVHLDDVLIEEDLSTRVDYYSFTTGSYHIGAIEQDLDDEYILELETIGGIPITVGSYKMNENTRILVSDLNIPEGDGISFLRWRMDRLPIGAVAKVKPTIDGIVKGEIEIEDSINNHLEISWEEGAETTTYSVNKSSAVDNFCVLDPSLRRISSQKDVRPGDIITYRMQLNCMGSRIYDPTIAMLLPPQLEYVGNVSMKYTDYFSSQGVSVPPAPEVPTPPDFKPYVKEEFNDEGETLVRFSYLEDNAFDFKQRASMTIEFDAKVKVGALGSIDAYMLADTPGNSGVAASNVDVYDDYENIDGSGEPRRTYTRSSKVSNNILLYPMAEAIKKVKGAEDEEYKEYPDNGTTYQGETVYYEIGITNTGNMTLQDIEIVDILPHIDDKGVIETGVDRGSEFEVYNINEVYAFIEPLLEGQSEPIITQEYSTSYNPVRFGKKNDQIGEVDDWSSTPPSVVTDLKSFKVKTDHENTVLHPGQTLYIRIQGIVPAGTSPESVAFNSYATKIGYINNSGKMQYLLPTEPQKIGVEVIAAPEGTVKIGGIAWSDTDRDGMYEKGEVGINDVVVALYSGEGKGELLYTTLTAPNSKGEPGYYLFNNLEPGKYVAKFIIDSMNEQFSPAMLYEERGSKANPINGLSPFIEVEAGRDRLDINVGISDLTHADRMARIIKANKSANSMIRNVMYNEMLLSMKLEETTNLIE